MKLNEIFGEEYGEDSINEVSILEETLIPTFEDNGPMPNCCFQHSLRKERKGKIGDGLIERFKGVLMAQISINRMHVFCGVIDDSRTERDAREVTHLNENVEDCILGDEGPEAALLNIHEGFSKGGKKTKRCPRVGNPRLGNVVGESAPAQGDRKGLQKKFNEHICASCRNAAPCKIHNNCGMCSNWCENTDSFKQPDPSESMVGSPLQILPQYPPGIPTPFQTNVGFNQGAGNIVMESRSNIVGSTEKKTFNVENNTIQPMKGIILRLLGMTDIGDADDMGIWITTNSNNPPIFENRNNAQKILSLCRDAGSELQEEAKEGAKDMVAFMWSQLHNELQNRLHQHGKNHMTKEEVGNMVRDLFKNINLAQALRTPPADDSQTRLEEMPQEFLPRYPVESQPEGFIMHQEMNPDIIEAPPNGMDQRIGAINENMLDEFDKNRGNTDGNDIKINSRMNLPVENGAPSNQNPMEGPAFGEPNTIPQSPPLEKIGANAIDFVKEVSQDVAKQGHKINKMYSDIRNEISLPKMDTAERSLHPGQSETSEPSKPSESFPLPIPADHPLGSPVNSQEHEFIPQNDGSRTYPNGANWYQHPSEENPTGGPVDNRIPIDQNVEPSEPNKQKMDEISRPFNRYKGKIDSPPSSNKPTTNNMLITNSPISRLSEPEDAGIILSENKEFMKDKNQGTLTDKTVDTKERVGNTEPQTIEGKASENPDIESKSQTVAKMDNDHSILGTSSGQDIIPQKGPHPDNMQVEDMQPEMQDTEGRGSRTHKKLKKLKEKLHKSHFKQPQFYRANGNDNLRTFEIIPGANVVGAPAEQSDVPNNFKTPTESLGTNQENKEKVEVIPTNDVLEVDQDSKSSGTVPQQSLKPKDENVAQRTFDQISRLEKPTRRFDSIKEALEKLRYSTKNLNREIITQAPVLVDEDDDNDVPGLGNPLQNSGKTLEDEVKSLPEVLLEKAESKLSSAEKTLENLEENANQKNENVLGSEPLENSLELYALDGRSNKMNHMDNQKIPSSEDINVGNAYNPPTENLDNLPPDANGNNVDAVSLSNRMQSPEETVRWSDSLGSLVTGDGITINGPKEIFFVGNGIKLPLNMVKKNDGALHLSVDVDKLCGCKNETCIHNTTAIEETVGSILEKEAELKDQLEQASEALENRNSEERAHIGSVPFETKKGENGGQEGVKSNFPEGFGSAELQHENQGVIKRSAVDPKQDVELINITPNNFYQQTGEKKAELHSTTAPPLTTWKSNFAMAPTKTASEVFKDFWSKGVEDLSSRFSAMDAMLPLPISINIFKDPFKKEVNAKSTTEESIIVPKTSPVTPLRDSFNPLLIPQQIFRTFLPTEEKSNQFIPASGLVNQRVFTTETSAGEPQVKSFSTDSVRKHSEQYDRVSKARGPYQFEGLHENLKALDDTVDKAKKENEKVLRENTEILVKANDEAAKQQTGIVDNFMKWLKGVGLRHEN